MVIASVAGALTEGWGLDRPLVETRQGGCNAAVWDVYGAGRRYIAKLAHPTPSFLGGLEAAAFLSTQGLRSGPPVPDGNGSLSRQLGSAELALLVHVAGRPLMVRRLGEAWLWGHTLAQAHTGLRRATPPVDSWPWPWLSGHAPHLDYQGWIRPAFQRAVERALEFTERRCVSQTVLHGDPSPREFLLEGPAGPMPNVGLVDWGSAARGPALYDLASLTFFAPNRAALTAALDGYGHRLLLSPADHQGLEVFVKLRWAAQAWYFSWRLVHDVTVGGDREFNERSLREARTVLRP